MADRSPDDARLQLAYAKLLTLQDGSRLQGIKRLSELARNPDVKNAARQGWREVLLWQGASKKARTQLLACIKENPNDSQIEAERLGAPQLRAGPQGRYEEAAMASDPANTCTRANIEVLRQRQKVRADIKQAGRMASQRTYEAYAVRTGSASP